MQVGNIFFCRKLLRHDKEKNDTFWQADFIKICTIFLSFCKKIYLYLFSCGKLYFTGIVKLKKRNIIDKI